MDNTPDIADYKNWHIIELPTYNYFEFLKIKYFLTWHQSMNNSYWYYEGCKFYIEDQELATIVRLTFSL